MDDMSGEGGPASGNEGRSPFPRGVDWQYVAGFALVIVGLIIAASLLRKDCDCDKDEELASPDSYEQAELALLKEFADPIDLSESPGVMPV